MFTKPILDMHEKSKKLTHIIPSNIQKSLGDIMRYGRGLSPLQCLEFSFEYPDGSIQYIVELEKKTCDCSYWALSGLPCAYALVCIVNKHMKPTKFVDISMTKEMYARTYSHFMKPIPYESRWPFVEFAHILPPIGTRTAG